MSCEIFYQIFSSFYSNVTKDLKHSLPSGLGLSETQITSHGFDSTKEGVTEAGAPQGKNPLITKIAEVEDGSFTVLLLLKKTRVELFISLRNSDHKHNHLSLQFK
jgi:hypothetical protein